MRLKYYHGAEPLHFDGKHKQYHISVIASSRKRVIEMLALCNIRTTLGRVATYYSMCDGPSVQMEGKPREESIWIEAIRNEPYVCMWPRPFKVGDTVRFRNRVQDIRPSVVKSVSNGLVKLDDGKEWGWSSLMLDSEWQKKQNS